MSAATQRALRRTAVLVFVDGFIASLLPFGRDLSA